MSIVITGASGGIGEALTIGLQDYEDLILIYNNNYPNYSIPVEGRCVKCDITNAKQVEKVFSDFDYIDILINNAGIVSDALVKNMTETQWDQVLDVNLKGAFLCSKYAIPKMGFGSHIVNISSVLSHSGVIGASNYAASKGGLEAFTRSLARELVKDGIFVNCIMLGFFDVGLGTRLDLGIREKVLQQIPLHKFGYSAEIVRTLEFIIGSRYLVGTVINLSGGFYL